MKKHQPLKITETKLRDHLQRGLVAPLEVPCVTCETTFSDPEECDPCLDPKTGEFTMARPSPTGVVNEDFIKFVKPYLRS